MDHIKFDPKFNINNITSNISRKLLYCNNCFYGIFNNLQDMQIITEETFTEDWE